MLFRGVSHDSGWRYLHYNPTEQVSEGGAMKYQEDGEDEEEKPIWDRKITKSTKYLY